MFQKYWLIYQSHVESIVFVENPRKVFFLNLAQSHGMDKKHQETQMVG